MCINVTQIRYNLNNSQMVSKQQLSSSKMVTEHSQEHNGVRCFYCNIQLPRNEWKFDCAFGFLCFYDILENGNTISLNLTTGGASSTYLASQGGKAYKYFRGKTCSKYKCASCFAKTQAQDLCKSVFLQLQGKGVIAFPHIWEYTKSQQDVTITSLQYGTRLSGHPDGKTSMQLSYQSWQKWKLQHIGQDKYYLRSKTHGTYLTGSTEGHITLTTNKKALETWIKKDCGSWHMWKSCHGNYLSCNQDGLVFLSPNQTKNQYWIDI